MNTELDHGWNAGSTCSISYFNTCTGWTWIWSGFGPGDKFGTCFDNCSSSGTLISSSVHVWTAAPSGYGFTGTITVSDADASCCPTTDLSSQTFLPVSGWNQYSWSVGVSDRFAISITHGPAPGSPLSYASDHPLAGPTGPPACGACYPTSRVEHSFFWGTAGSPLCPGSTLNDGSLCGAEWLAIALVAGGPPQPGACCFEDGSCDVLLAADCFSLGGQFQGAGTDCSVQCPILTGACCFEDGSCEITLADECASLGGIFLGKDTDCSDACPSFAGACCFEDGSCEILLAGECASVGGFFQGSGTDCSTPCPPFAGSCCLDDGSCVIADGPSDCAAQGGTFRGVGTDCTTPCPSNSGACCFSDGSCQLVDAATCAALGGEFHGVGSSCGFCQVQGYPAYDWTISDSNTSPFVNTDMTTGFHSVYLWLACSDLPGGLQ
ncbi:MAG: hypothetical protein ACRDGR_02525, partial [bacterium]